MAPSADAVNPKYSVSVPPSSPAPENTLDRQGKKGRRGRRALRLVAVGAILTEGQRASPAVRVVPAGMSVGDVYAVKSLGEVLDASSCLRLLPATKKPGATCGVVGNVNFLMKGHL